jgi:hypothetical protein
VDANTAPESILEAHTSALNRARSIGSIRQNLLRGSILGRLRAHYPRANEANEFPDALYLIDMVVCDLDTGELILDHHHDLQAIKPVGPEILGEARLIGNAFNFDAKVFGEEHANPVGRKVFCCGGQARRRTRSADTHEYAPTP